MGRWTGPDDDPHPPPRPAHRGADCLPFRFAVFQSGQFIAARIASSLSYKHSPFVVYDPDTDQSQGHRNWIEKTEQSHAKDAYTSC